MFLSANVKWLFGEAGTDIGDRIRMAARHGISHIEIAGHSTLDLPALRDVLDETGSRIEMLQVEGMVPLGNRDSHADFRAQVLRACKAAEVLRAPRIVTASGPGIPALSRAVQHAVAVEALRAGADMAGEHGITLVLENVNTRVDHPGILFDLASECIAAIRAADVPHLGLMLDIYHTLQMGEAPLELLHDHIDLLSCVQIADVPGRQEPGTGQVDWHSLIDGLYALGYRGPVGLEYQPCTDTVASLRHIGSIVSSLSL